MNASETCQSGAVDCRNCLDRRRGWFCALGEPALEELETCSTSISLPAKVSILDQGCMPSNLYVICSGQVKLSVQGQGGQKAVVRVAGPGSVLGLFAVLSGREYELSASTLTPVRLRSIGQDAFLRLLSRSQEIQQRVLKTVCKDYLAVFDHYCRAVLPETADQRLAQLLLDIGEEHNRGAIDREVRLPCLLTQAEIATMIGTTRETVSRSFSQFRKNGAISFEGSDIVLRDPASLRAVLG